MRGLLLCLAASLFLAGCGAEPVWAPDDVVARAKYRSDEPPSLTLVTVISNRDNSGAHAGLVINASHRVVFDPAGTFKTDVLPERNDVVYGMSPAAYRVYIDYHARETFRVVTQEVQVSPQVAEQTLRLAEAYGAVPKANCTIAISNILRQVPGFEGAPGTYWPKRMMKYFETMPGVMSRTIYDDDPDFNKPVLQSAAQLLDE